MKLADFGKARKISDYMNPGQETNARNKSGSPYYMAPELFQDDGVYSFASDLWSLGWLLFEFLTGKLPFSSNSLNRLMKMIQDEQPPLNLLTVSKDLFNIIWLWLEKDPSTITLILSLLLFLNNKKILAHFWAISSSFYQWIILARIH